MNTLARAIFFDRDGVLNKSLLIDGLPQAPATLSEFEIYPEARALLNSLRGLGYFIFVVTNQPNVAKGIHARENVEALNKSLVANLGVDEIFTCYHRDEDACACRKPKPGSLFDAARKYGLDLSACYMVGDRWRDIEAGRNAGCTTIWIDRGYRERTPEQQDFQTSSLTGAVQWILGRSQHQCVAVPTNKQLHQGESVQ